MSWSAGWPAGRAEVYQELFGALGLPDDPPARSGFHLTAHYRLSAAALADPAITEMVWKRTEWRVRRLLDQTAAEQGWTVDPGSVIRHYAMAHAYSDDGPVDLAHSILGPARFTDTPDLELKPDYFTVVWLARHL